MFLGEKGKDGSEKGRELKKKIVIHTERKHKILVVDLTHSLQLSFLHWVKVILSETGWATARYKVIRWLLSLARVLQLVIICFCVGTSLATPVLQISVSSSVPVENSVRQMHRYLMGGAENSHSAETDSGSQKHDIRLSNKKYFWTEAIMVQRTTFAPGAKSSDYGFETMCVLLSSRDCIQDTSNILLILSTYPLFWDNCVNLPIFSSDNMKSKLSVLLWSILTGDVSTCDVR